MSAEEVYVGRMVLRTAHGAARRATRRQYAIVVEPVLAAQHPFGIQTAMFQQRT